jgi:hypothetical protein
MRLLAAFALGVLGVAVSTGTPIVQGNTMSSAAAVPCAGVQTLHSTAGCSMQYGSNAVMPGQNTAFSLQAQAGNRSLTSTDELRILDTSGVSAITSASGDLAWTNGTAFSFQISYDAATRALSYTVNGTTLVANLAAAALITDVLIQTQATSVGSIMTISDLVVNGVNLPGSMSQASQANAGRQVDYLWISGLRDSFTMSGRIELSWYRTAPTGTGAVANLRFGAANHPDAFALSAAAQVPEPKTYALFGVALVALGCWRVKRKNNPKDQ